MTPEQGQAVANRMGARYIECSSKEKTGVHEVFELAVDLAVGREQEVPKWGNGRAAAGGVVSGTKKYKKRGCRIL